jgi:uncharacterized OB-fold protein
MTDPGVISFQRCRACSNAWLPQRTECPRCLAADWTREDASGRGKLVSWVVYHRAYHESVADRVPYNVSLIELAEGPRVLANLIGDADLHADMPVRVVVGRRNDRPIVMFEPEEAP